MKHLSRIVWAEGMYLGPHHFQAQSRYFEDFIHFATESLWFSAFGFIGYEMDGGALSNGMLKLSHARGVFADGLPFAMPVCDPVPEARRLDSLFPATVSARLVYLAVPDLKQPGGNCVLEGERGENGTRFYAKEAAVRDEISGGDIKPVRFGMKHIKLLLEGENLDGWQTLPLARVKRDGAGQFAFDERFIPPVLKFNANPALMRITARQIDMLTQKNAGFTGATRGYEKQSTGLSPQQIQVFWFLHSVNSALTSLKHLYHSKQAHPEELYTEMLRLGGALCTFSLDSLAAALPVYDHLDLQACFEALDQHIQDHLELVVPTNCLTVKLEQVDKYFWEGDLPDSRVLGTASWYLSVRSQVGEAELITGAPALVKLCSARFVRQLVSRAVPGLKLTHVGVPPSSLSPRVGNQYFAVNRSGPCWDDIVDKRRVGVYVPGDLPAPELDLLVLVDS